MAFDAILSVNTAGTPPSIQGAPTLSGTLQPGSILTVTPATVDGDTPLTTAVDFYLTVSGSEQLLTTSNGPTFTALIPDQTYEDGDSVRAVQRSTNAFGQDTSSSQSEPIVIPDTPPPPPTTPGVLTYTLEASPGPDGDQIALRVTQTEAVDDNFAPDHFAWRIEDPANPGTYQTGRTINTTTPFLTQFKGFPNATQTVEIAQVSYQITRLYVRSLPSATADLQALVGQTVTHQQTGATATITGYNNVNNQRERYLTINNITGFFEAEGDLLVNGTVVTDMIKTDGQPSLFPAPSEIQQTPWQANQITTSTGTPTINITTADGRTTYTEGENIGFKVEAMGFHSDRPAFDRLWQREELEYRMRCITPGNSRDAVALPTDWIWSRDISEGWSDLWGTHSLTTGNLTYEVEAWHPSDFLGRVTQTIDITVNPKSAVFTPANTYVFDPAGIGTGAPATTNPIYTDIDVAVNAFRNQATGTTRRLCIPTGVTISPTAMDFNGDGFALLCVDTYGTGARPIIETTGYSISLRGNSAAILEGFEQQGDYDATRPDDMTSLGTDGVVISDCPYASIYNTEHRGMRYCIEIGRPGTFTMMVDVSVTNYSEFGWFGTDSGAQYATGCSNTQPAGAIRSPYKFDRVAPFTANHGPGRWSRVQAERAFDNIRIHGWTGWSSNNSVQSFLRNFGQMLKETYLGALTRMQATGAEMSFGPTTNRAVVTPTDFVCRYFHVSGMNSPAFFLKVNCPGVSVSNGTIVCEDLVAEFDNDNQGMVTISALGDGRGAYHGAQEAEVIVRSLTLVNLKTAPNIQSGRTWTPVQLEQNDPLQYPNPKAVVVGNILEHAPGWVGGVDNSPLDQTTRFDPGYDGQYEYSYPQLDIIAHNGAARPSRDSGDIVTGQTSGATGQLKFTERHPDDPSSADALWLTGQGRGTLFLNATTTGTFQVGETVTLTTGGTAEVAAYQVGTYDDVTPVPGTALTGLSSASWAPVGTAQDGNLDPGVVLPWGDQVGNVRRRDGTGATGAMES